MNFIEFFPRRDFWLEIFCKNMSVCPRKRDIHIFKEDFISLAGALHFEFISSFLTFILRVTLAPILYIRIEFSCLQKYI
jgi:hypothetical protein